MIGKCPFNICAGLPHQIPLDEEDQQRLYNLGAITDKDVLRRLVQCNDCYNVYDSSNPSVSLGVMDDDVRGPGWYEPHS